MPGPAAIGPKVLAPALLVPAFVLLVSGAAALAQSQPASPVRYTEVREAPMRRVITLPGTVESRTSSLVATEVEGLVVDLPAREGDTLRKGAPIARLRTTSLELQLRASRAELKEAASRLKLAELNLERIRGLFRSEIASQQQLDDAQYEHAALEGRVEQLAARIDQIQHDIDRSTIVAPFGGTVVSKRTEIGEWLAVGAPVVEMISLAEMEVRVEVPERYFQSMDPGAAATVTFESLPGIEVRGRVLSVIPKADARARTFPVKVHIPNREGRIGAGMLAQVALPAGESYRATVVPKDAVVSQGPQQVVFLINGDNTVTPVTVATGDGLGAWIAVEGPLRHGQKVVTRGNERLRPGQQVVGEPLDYTLP